MASLTTLRNLGPVSERMLGNVGIVTVDDLREVGSELAFRMVAHRHPGATRHLLYALVGALSGRHWASFSPEEKAAILARAEGELEVGPGSGQSRSST
jgi:DNA transformation protein